MGLARSLDDKSGQQTPNPNGATHATPRLENISKIAQNRSVGGQMQARARKRLHEFLIFFFKSTHTQHEEGVRGVFFC